ADAAKNDALLRRIKAELPDFVGNIVLFSLDGSNIGTSSTQGRFNAGDRRYFQQALAGQRLAIGQGVIARALREWAVMVARPIEDQAGRVRAVIAIGTLLEHFQDALRVKGLPPGSVVCIIDEKGTVIARSIDGKRWIGQNVGASAEVARRLSSKGIS